MKRHSNVPLRVEIEELDMELVTKVKFLFKEAPYPCEPVILVKEYDKDIESTEVVYDPEEKIFIISISREESALFPNGKPAYIEAFPVTKDGFDIEVEITKFDVNRTMKGGCTDE